MKNGVPYDAAFAMSEVDTADVPLDVEGLASAVVFGEMEGGEYDWSERRWMEKHG